MEITLRRVPIRELYEGYVNNDEEGVVGYDGQLNIRPKYQREFIYKDEQRDLVIDSIIKNYPLGIMYWAKVEDDEEDSYELMDGQQRTISICSYVNGDYAIDYKYFHNLTEDEQEQLLDYELMIYIAEGSEKQKLDWFKIINIAGEELTDQELRNAVYTGPWLEHAKRHFSKSNCPAYTIGSDYMRGTPIRQDYLETVIKWHKDDGEEIEEYMGRNQENRQANELWLFFQRVINWVEVTFTTKRREMKGLPWGEYYKTYKDEEFNSEDIEERVKELMSDDDVTKKSGIYLYVLSGDTKHLNIRAFSNRQRREAFERQDGVCPRCGETFEIEEMEADHITPWSEGGKTVKENCQMLCKECNRRKSNI